MDTLNNPVQERDDDFCLGIVIPLKSEQVSKSWKLVYESLEKTLVSIGNQGSSKFRVCVVCHEVPPLSIFDSPWCDAVTIDVPAPDIAGKKPSEKQVLFEKDRTAKLEFGSNRLVEGGCTHIFALDADDLIHRDFVSTVEQYQHYQSLVFKYGYLNFQRYKLINKTSSFDLYCGSCCVVQASLLYMRLSDSTVKDFVFRLISHSSYAPTFKKLDISCFVPQSYLVMYMREHGENISAQRADLYQGNSWLKSFSEWLRRRLKRSKRFTTALVRSFAVSRDVKSQFGL
ncbi:hypothetical protein [Alteromonas sp. KUL49]|uniref:hypothetical protein n=1 Tax=Alteromonas sp. KUL49 TaxID=2480798 RepID=UPI00102EF036|nr:hypothetical protein [Alteromonas sp. KUL49]TAP41445.1 hypothetical protein EYS00_04465 [Alteromonas sp. KUL49]GEA10522.1 hypothetical protein KUL49_08970 [Alteromonas sp. KUL49]